MGESINAMIFFNSYLDFLKVVHMVFWSGVVGPGTSFRSLAFARSLALRAHCRAMCSKAGLVSKSNSYFAANDGRGGGGVGENSHIKVIGMLVVWLRGVNSTFWSLLGSLGQKVTIFAYLGVT